VQLYLKNSLTCLEYTKEDVNGDPHEHDGKHEVLNDAWHEKHLTRLADYIIQLLDECDNVPDYLLAHPSQEFTPPNLIAKHQD